MEDFEKRWWGEDLIKTPKIEKYGDEWWFGGEGGGQVVIGEWVSGGDRTANPRRWATLLKQSELIAATLGHYANHRSCPVASLADAQAEIARLRGALEEITETSHCHEANRIAHLALNP